MKDLRPFSPQQHFNENMATRYEKRIRLFCPGYDALHTMLPALLAGLPAKARLLSVGAGTGAEVLSLGGQHPAWEFMAVDVSPEMLALAQQKVDAASMGGRVSFFQGFVQEMPEMPPFDAATSIFVAHFIKSYTARLAYFKAIAQRLAPGAPLVVADLCGDRETPQFQTLYKAWRAAYSAHGIAQEEVEKDFMHIQNDVDFMPAETIAAILQEAGFSAPASFYQTLLFSGWVVYKNTK